MLSGPLVSLVSRVTFISNWMRYKTAEGKKENKFGFGGKPQGAAFARKIVDARIRRSRSSCLTGWYSEAWWV